MRRAEGTTRVDVVALIIIVGVMTALLLSALLRSRTPVRIAHCKNNLKNIGLAMKNHEGVHGFYPSGGWGNRWVGHPDFGTGVLQPGGWAYAILPFMEREVLHDLGSGFYSPENLDPPQQRKASAERLQTPLPVFYCPDRRRVKLYPAPDGSEWQLVSPVTEAARTDYAANGGDTWVPFGDGPKATDGSLNGRTAHPFIGGYRFPAPAGDPASKDPERRNFTGIVFVHNELHDSSIEDGESNTLMVGEKFMNPDDYLTGTGIGDRQSVYHGGDGSLVRWVAKNGFRGGHVDGKDTVDTLWPPRQDRRFAENPPTWPRPRDTGEGGRIFGSAHAGGCSFVFADGSVRTIHYTIDPLIFAQLGNRSDGAVADPR